MALFDNLLAMIPKNLSFVLERRNSRNDVGEKSTESHLSSTREMVLGNISVVAFNGRTGCSSLK